MERTRGLEPPPTAWQAVVLPLYYGRSTYLLIARAQNADKLVPCRTKQRHHRRCPSAQKLRVRENGRGLDDLHDARSLHHRRLLLPLGELGGLGAVNVHARELFAIVVIDSDEPVPVLAPPVFSQLSSFSSLLHTVGAHGLWQLNPRDASIKIGINRRSKQSRGSEGGERCCRSVRRAGTAAQDPTETAPEPGGVIAARVTLEVEGEGEPIACSRLRNPHVGVLCLSGHARGR